MKDLKLCSKMNNSDGYFLTVSSLNYRKNFITVLQAFSKFCDSNHYGNLFIVGDLKNDSFKGIDIQTYKNNERIKFLGRVSDDELIEYYCNAIAFVFPSLYEGFGIPVIEAQACGCPVISSDSSSLPEVLGESALFCNPMDVDSFAKYMKMLYNDNNLRTQLIARGYENVKRFSWDDGAKKIIELILEQ